MIDWVVEAGGLDRTAANWMKQLNPVYLPFKRAFIDEISAVKGAGKIAGQGSAIKKIKGSG